MTAAHEPPCEEFHVPARDRPTLDMPSNAACHQVLVAIGRHIGSAFASSGASQGSAPAEADGRSA